MGVERASDKGRLKGLDGIRAMCALFILWGHIPQETFGGWGEINDCRTISLPILCAYVFFVLSGFLAGYNTQGKIDQQLYYKRRARRILPLYYIYIIACIIVFICIGRSNEVLNPGILYYFLLLPEIPFSISQGLVPLVHLWFVGVIVLFYFLYPFYSRINEKYKCKVAFLFALFWALLKWLLYLLVGKDTFVYRFVGITSFDCLFLGIWLGTLWRMNNPSVMRIARNRSICTAAWGLFLCSGIYGNYVPAPARTEFIAILAGLLMLNQVSDKPVLPLENKLLKWMSSISFEIYVVHILIIIILSLIYSKAGWHWPSFVIYAVCTLVVIMISDFCSRLTRIRE